MSRNWIRSGRLELEGTGKTIQFGDLRIRFLVRQSRVQSLNAAEFRIYNLSDATKDQIVSEKTEFKLATLSAGYESNSGIIYKGNILHTQAGRENPTDTYVDVFCRDGDRAYNWGVVKKTFAAGSKQRDHVDEVVRVFKELGVTEGTIKGLSDQKYPRAVTLYGMAREIMRTIAHSNNATWDIRNGKLFHTPHDDKGEGSEIRLNSNTGLIGMPVETPQGIIVTALINPDFKIGCKLKIDEKSINRAPWGLNYSDDPSNLGRQTLGTADGVYTVFSLEWRGDTRGQEWYATMYCYGSRSGSLPIGSENIVGYTGP